MQDKTQAFFLIVVEQSSNDEFFNFLMDQAKKELDEHEDWLKKTGRNPKTIEDSLKLRRNALLIEVQWKHFFIGQRIVPENWDVWCVVQEFFEKSNATQLPEDLVAAGVLYPDHRVVLAVAHSQKLNIKLLESIFYRKDIPQWCIQKIVDAQQAKGVSYRDIVIAMHEAEILKKRNN